NEGKKDVFGSPEAPNTCLWPLRRLHAASLQERPYGRRRVTLLGLRVDLSINVVSLYSIWARGHLGPVGSGERVFRSVIGPLKATLFHFSTTSHLRVKTCARVRCGLFADTHSR